MSGPTRALTPESLGAWLLKTSPRTSPVGELVRTGFATVAARCIRPTYRADLVAPGQPVLLWVSGGDRRHPAGVYAQGTTTGEAHGEGDELVMPVRLAPLVPPVPRHELLEQPGLSALEVLRMPAGSNPSYLTREQLAVLRAEFPQLTVG